MALPTPGVRKHLLNPCMFFAHREEHIISTLLGSCVSVCLWDPKQRFGGMNHYMLPLWNGKGLPTPKYGNIAIEKLIKQLITFGCRKEDLIAKVFGGGNVIELSPEMYSIGERNIQLAEEFLEMNSIPILASEVGGKQALKVEFNTKHGTVILRKVVQSEWVPLALPEGKRLK